MNRLILIDGNAVLHRAYHAIPPLTAPDGSVVNAVYGFASMLMRLVGDLRPTHMAVAFDRPKPTFRKKMFKDYQGKRPEMDKELVDQIPKVHRLIEAFGIPVFEKDGFEADDVIGTLCRLVTRDTQHVTGKKKSNVSHITSHMSPKIDQVIIVTGDRDILQLVEDDRVLAYMPTKGLSEAKLYREKDVKERLGVDPKHVTDFKGLAGDSSDNYPGVAGIGPKTAISLIHAFGSVEGVYNYVDLRFKNKDLRSKDFDEKGKEVSQGVMEKLLKGRESAYLSKDLATIRTNVPLDGEIKKSRISSLDTPEARAVLDELHFHSLLKRLDGSEKTELEQKKKKEKPKEKTGEQQQLF